MIPERLSRLRREMEQRRIDVYVVPTADFHESEYVGAHFKARSYITGFTGSAGTAIITMTEAGLWTDARYFLQAKHQLENTGVTLYRMGEEGVPTIMEYLRSALPEGGTLGFDGRVINARLGAEFLALAEKKNAKLAVSEDLVGIIWDDRPELPHAPVRILTAEYSGRSTADKLADVRAEMEKQGASVHLLTSLYDIAWLLNVRGGDIDYVPVVLSYLALTRSSASGSCRTPFSRTSFAPILPRTASKRARMRAFTTMLPPSPPGRRCCSTRACATTASSPSFVRVSRSWTRRTPPCL